jgi:hypothetical protein
MVAHYPARIAILTGRSRGHLVSITERRATDAATMVEAYTAAALRGERLSICQP